MSRPETPVGEYISALTAITTVTATDQIIALQSGAVKSVTPNLIMKYGNTNVLSVTSASTTYTASDCTAGGAIVYITSGSGSDITVTLPDPATLTAGYPIELHKIDSGSAIAEITATAGNINGASSIYLVEQFNNITLIPNGSNYLVVDHNIFYTFDWTNESDWTNQEFPITHNFGFHLSNIRTKILLSATGSDSDCFEFYPMTNLYDSATPAAANVIYGMIPLAVDTNNIKIQTGTNGVRFIDDTGGGTSLAGSSSYYIKVFLELEYI